MEKKVICQKDEIYIGLLKKVYYKRKINTKKGIATFSLWRDFRGMLFKINEDLLAEDLIFSSPQYPVEGITPQKLQIHSSLMIASPVKLKPLLDKSKIGNDITNDDLTLLFEALIQSNKWQKKNGDLLHVKVLKLLLLKICYVKDGEYYNDCLLEAIGKTLADIYGLRKGLPHPVELGYPFVKKID